MFIPYTPSMPSDAYNIHTYIYMPASTKGLVLVKNALPAALCIGKPLHLILIRAVLAAIIVYGCCAQPPPVSSHACKAGCTCTAGSQHKQAQSTVSHQPCSHLSPYRQSLPYHLVYCSTGTCWTGRLSKLHCMPLTTTSPAGVLYHPDLTATLPSYL